jgi:Cu/Ag efflux protein CusF
MKKSWLVLALTAVITPAHGAVPSISNSNHHISNHIHGHVLTAPAANHIVGTGKVVSVDAVKQTIKIKHDPIKSLNWPMMTMSFAVEQDVNLTDIKTGDSVTFTMKPDPTKGYIVSSLAKN